MAITTAKKDGVTTLFEDALRLPADLRGELVTLLLDSLDEAGLPVDGALEDLPPGMLTEESKAELDRRIKSIEDGTAELIPAEEVFRDIYQRLDNGDL